MIADQLPSPKLRIRDLYPDLDQADLAEAEENLRQLAMLFARMADRLVIEKQIVHSSIDKTGP